MLLNEIVMLDDAAKKMMSKIEFIADDDEISMITQRLEQKRIKPTLTNVKHHLLLCLLKPLDKVPLPERTIIMRSGRPERFE